MRKIIFGHHRALGDALMFTAGIRDFKLLFPDININVDSNFPALWENNPYIDRSIKKDDKEVEYYKVGYPIINNANNSPMHFVLGFLFDMISIVDTTSPLPISLGEFTSVFANGTIGDPGLWKLDDSPEVYKQIKDKYDKFCREFARQRADIHLTDKEKSYNMIEDIYGYEKYWVVAPGGKSDCTCKIWDWRRFQEVIDHFNERIKFIVIGRSDHIVEKLNNVIDLTNKFNDDIRGLIPLVYHSEGCISGVTFLMHLAAASPPRFDKERKPCVSIYGGRENVSFTAYTNHQILHTNGSFDCCDNGGCWQSRVIPLPKKESGNKRLCHHPVMIDGRTIPTCMDTITSNDVIRAIEKYYDGNIYTYTKPLKKIEVDMESYREINILASLSSKGGGEQSSLMIAKMLRDAGWVVNFYPWDKVNEKYINCEVSEYSFKNGMEENMKLGIPLLFYANDQIGPFIKEAQGIVNKSSDVIIGINYINSSLPKCDWLHKTDKLRAVIFQNEEKRNEFERDRIGFENTEQIVLFGAIDLNKFLEICPKKRDKDEDLIVLKHCVPDYRKYVTKDSVNGGEKIHLWQKRFIKELDTKFYSRLLKDIKNVRFEFMEAHKELIEYFNNEPRMIFHKFDSMPVEEFLSKGHIYLYRASNKWRDNYPRVMAEALASGLPVIGEPRDGTKDRIQHGDTGFYACHYDEYLLHLKTLYRKEDMRYSMGVNAKDWAKNNLDPRDWVTIIEEILYR